ncbi:MAG: glycosyltransferase [Reyranella sp.]|uniref:glycosyltransferase n=1 Tax=Reyranella sp. TaxID=1929291 RepID=UPI003D0E0BC6
MSAWTGIGLLALAIWSYLLLARGGFWLVRERDTGGLPAPSRWPAVVAVVPARNEADVIARSIGSLLRQDYPGPFRIVLVDDGSSDGTAGVAGAIEGGRRLDVLSGTELPSGWTGKLWALEQGIRHATAQGDPVDYFLLTDADIGHTPDNLRMLVARAEQDGRVLVSLMAELSCASWAERSLIPAFVYFFRMLYPFAWVARRDRRTAAAAGGCILVRRDALERSGGIAAIRSEIIDDCALARRLKDQGPIWLGLTRRATSLRPYGGFLKIGHMIARSAYAQLGYSPLVLAATIASMALVYLVPPLLALLHDGPARWLGLCAWLVMALSFQPMLRFYRQSPLWGLALPAIGAAYAFFTVQSAIDCWRGRGGLWKGRAQAMTGGI